MKKLLLLTAALLIAFASQAQYTKGKVYTADYDSVLTVETVYTGNVYVKGDYDKLTIQALCTDVGGVPDGTLILQGSVDGTSFVNLAPETGVYTYRPNNDTLTITAAAVQTVEITNPGFTHYRWKVTGTDGDSTLITTKYVVK